jgi:hypothetical protein
LWFWSLEEECVKLVILTRLLMFVSRFFFVALSKLVEKILKIYLKIWCWGKKKLQKDIDLKRHLFKPFYLKMGSINSSLESSKWRL